jgi:regulator of cell morphogenesis and NO signaling
MTTQGQAGPAVTCCNGREWTSAPLRELIHHLVDIDHVYFRSELKVLYDRLQAVVAEDECSNPALGRLPEILRALTTELDAHMLGEERELFPAILRYLDALEAGERPNGSPLAAFGGPLHLMEQEHENSASTLRVMRGFCLDYRVPARSCATYRELIERFQVLEDRLLRHIYIENNVLYPRAAALKSSRFSTAM